ncbi:transcriptional regulator, TetR family [Kribbella flavida DSM 17836]|uniref:Transcriptional regulator, TetR family n=1 Tax=Kribbella flavida (strain DSM 17836 / JCM 10339 / NBRC 14399) TaxID=479435 RepID=D2Q2A6_KRIFD|nr:TetR/AcrR family transcriptional regulator [Kribbella flavida]ADB35802.1 transcriptional regulator, TetR family [Kribbella flavida DSM 17836]
MSRRIPRAESQARTRARLLTAAAELFAERGVNGASVEQIAERAGYTRGAFYGNFTGKPALVAALLEHRTEHEYAEVSALTGDADSLRAWHRDRSTGAADWLALRLELLRYAVREQPEILDHLRARESYARQAHAGWLTRLFADEGLEPPAEITELALIVHALEDGLLIQRTIDPDTASPEATLAAVELLARSWLALARNARA